MVMYIATLYIVFIYREYIYEANPDGFSVVSLPLVRKVRQCSGNFNFLAHNDWIERAAELPNN